jgi:uroporphyrin-III C-methyltransferase/precorrin-2 dehydrogenase/sirohydrochlorin ferrochelatase
MTSPSKPPSERASAGAPARIEPLAVLPVFLSLRDRAALVVGGSPAAAWKADLLAAAGARVTVVAGPCAWRESDFTGVALAVADLETEDEAARFAAAARRAGVPYNVIDKPAFCSLQFGAIVNRSPVVIGISTDGAAPVLGQAIRRRIEALLPCGLAAWAQAAQEFRAGLKALLPSAERRRTFWRAFAEAAFTEAPPAAPVARLRALAGAGPEALPGVILVGAGPGDAGLLTLNAVRALQAADVILFDDAVSPAVLDLARREAKRLLVGSLGDATAPMAKLARQGRRVVRLMAGDPLGSACAQGEIATLEAAGIAVSVVPGIAAAQLARAPRPAAARRSA